MRNFSDKILDNKYNQNDIQYEIFTDFKIDAGFNDLNYNKEADLSPDQLQLQEKLYNYIDTNYKNMLKLKLKKQDFNVLQEIFYNFYKTELDRIYYNEYDLFKAFCSFFGLHSDDFFYKLLPGYKEKVLNQIDNNNHILQKEKFFKIF